MEPLEPIVRYDPAGLRDELSRQVANLEAMFDNASLAALAEEHPEHPAVERYSALQHLLNHDGSYSPDEESSLVLMTAGGMVDRSTWAVDPSGGEYWDIIPDPAAREFVRTRIGLPKFYEDVVSELFYWGWLRSQGFEAYLGEEQGMPDLQVIVGDRATWADVKRIHVGTNPSRIRRDIGKANSQIKQADTEGVGLALIHVDRRGARASLDDRVPSDVRPYVEEAKRELSSDSSKSVAQVVLTWDDYFVISELDQPCLYAVRRRSLVLEHKRARAEPILLSAAWDVGLTTTVWTHYEGRSSSPLASIDAGKVVVTQAFREQNEFTYGVRAGHVVEAFSDPNALIRYKLDDDYSVVLATRRVNMGRRPHVLLVRAHEPAGKRPETTAGYKLYGTDEELAKIAHDPGLAFRTLLNRFAFPIRVGQQVGLFIPREIVQQPAEGTWPVVGLGSDPDSLTIEAVFRTSEETKTVDVRWAFALDLTAYRRSLVV